MNPNARSNHRLGHVRVDLRAARFAPNRTLNGNLHFMTLGPRRESSLSVTKYELHYPRPAEGITMISPNLPYYPFLEAIVALTHHPTMWGRTLCVTRTLPWPVPFRAEPRHQRNCASPSRSLRVAQVIELLASGQQGQYIVVGVPSESFEQPLGIKPCILWARRPRGDRPVSYCLARRGVLD